nr:phage tail assembly chaperone family protein, TAC [uncultured Moraxella sp.]
MTALNKAQFLATICTANVPVLKELDGIGSLYFKKLTVAEQGELAKKSENNDNVTASLNMVACSVCDENGKRLFNDSDIKELGKMNTEHLTVLVNAVSEINGFDKSLDDVKKN